MQLDQTDRDALIRTVLGEARGQPALGQAGVAHVVLNRVQSGKYGGNNVLDVVLKPHAFEPWSTPSTAQSLWRIPTSDPAYQRAGKIVDAVATGAVPDPTGGATHFLNAQTVRDRGTYNTANGLPEWAAGAPRTVIGDHAFYAPEGPVNNSAPMAYAPGERGSRGPAMDAINSATAGQGQGSGIEGLLQQLIQQRAAQATPAATQQQPGLEGFLGRGLMNLFNGNGLDFGAVKPVGLPSAPSAAAPMAPAAPQDAIDPNAIAPTLPGVPGGVSDIPMPPTMPLDLTPSQPQPAQAATTPAAGDAPGGNPLAQLMALFGGGAAAPNSQNPDPNAMPASMMGGAPGVPGIGGLLAGLFGG